MEENWNGQMYNCSKWPVPLQLNVTLLLPGILWLRNMLLVLPIVHNPPTVFSVTGDLEPSFVLVKFPTPLLVVSSSLSPPHPLSSPPSPCPVYIQRLLASPEHERNVRFYLQMHGGGNGGSTRKRWYINIPMGGRVPSGRGWLGFDIVATSTLKLHKRSWRAMEGDFVPCIGTLNTSARWSVGNRALFPSFCPQAVGHPR